MKMKQILSLLLSVTLVFSSVTPAAATENWNDDMIIEIEPESEIPQVTEDDLIETEFQMEDSETEFQTEESETEAFLLEIEELSADDTIQAYSDATVSGTCGNDAVWELDTETGVLVISGTGDMKSVGLSAPWADYLEIITEIQVESGITNIRGFTGISGTCPNLTKVTYPDTVTTIGAQAFSGCTALSDFEILPSVTTIGSSAFSGCTSLTSIEIPDSVTVIDSSAFSDSGLTEIVLPESVTEMNSSVFSGCESLKSCTLPANMTTLPDSFFNGCSSLTEITLPASITSIGYYAFKNCTSLTSIVLPESLESIMTDVFDGCTALESFSIAENNQSYSTVDGVLFNKDQTMLYLYPAAADRTSYRIPDGVTSIKYVYGFCYGPKLKEIYIPASLTDIGVSDYGGTKYSTVENQGSQSFFYCDQLERIIVDEDNSTYCSVDGVLFSKDMTVLYQYPRAKTDSSYQIPEGVETLEKDSFYFNPYISELLFSNSVKKLCMEAISGCTSLKTLRIPPTVETMSVYSFGFSAEADLILNAIVVAGSTPASDTLAAILEMRTMSGTKIIGCTGSAAETYASLHSVNFAPGYLVSFSDRNLTYTSKMVINGELYGTLPEPEQEGYIFEGWYTQESGGERINADDTVGISENLTLYAQWSADNTIDGVCGDNAIWELDKTTGALTITGTGRADLGYDTLTPSWSEYKDMITSVEVDSGITFVYGFSGCTNLTSVTLSDTVLEIGDSTFEECTGITYVSIPLSVTKIGAKAFYASGITEINLEDTVEEIGEMAFAEASSLRLAVISAGVEEIPYRAFYNCTALRGVAIQEGTTVIAADAFDRCFSLLSLTIPASVTQIGYAAAAQSADSGELCFQNCTSLASITVEAGNEFFSSADGVLFNKDQTILMKYPAAKTSTSYSIPDTVTEIWDYAFWDGGKLQSVSIPAGLQVIGEHGFSFLSALTTVAVNDENANYSSAEGVLYNKDKTVLIHYPACKSDSFFMIPKTVETIADHAFYGNSYIEELEFPESVQLLETFAVSKCENLNVIRITSKLTELSEYAYGFYSYGTEYGTIATEIPVCDETLTENQYTRRTIYSLSGSKAETYAEVNSLYFTEGYYVGFLNADESYDDLFRVPGDTYGELPSPQKEGYQFLGWSAEESGGTLVTSDDIFTGTAYTILYAQWQELEKDYDEGQCGDTATWRMNYSTGILVISGTGRADLGYDTNEVPWKQYLNQIKEVQIENGITFVYGLQGCTNLKNITLADTVTELGAKAFADCTALTACEITASVTVLGDGVFDGCTKLEAITVDSENAEYSSADGVLFDKDQTTLMKYPAAKAVVTYTVPDTVTEIAADAWKDGASVVEVRIPASVGVIGEYAFAFCDSLQKIAVDEANEAYSSEDGVLFDKTGETLIRYPVSKTGASYSIPSGVTVIKKNSFYNSNTLSELTIPDTVTEIQSSAIAKCPNVKSLLIPKTVTEIGDFAFGYSFFESALTPEEVNEQLPDTKYTDLSVTGRVDSAAAVFAEEHEIAFNAQYLITFANADTEYPSRILQNGQVYGVLPEPEREMYTFRGWFTAEIGGEQITAETIVNLNADLVLYAQWDEIPVAVLNTLTYGFGNSYADFGYSAGRKFPLSSFTYMYGNNVIAKQLYSYYKTWNGNCFGMSATSGIFNVEGSGVTTDQFDGTAALVSDLELEDTDSTYLNLSVREFIETVHVSQFAKLNQDTIRANKGALDQIVEHVKLVQKGGGPVILCLFGSGGGHAIIGYKVEEISDTESHLYVYDCNYPKQERYITLKRDSSGAYISWYYPISSTIDWGTDYAGSFISYIPYEYYYQVWSNKGKAYNAEYNLMNMNSDDVVITDVEGKQLALIENGELVSSSAEIIPIYELSLSEENTAVYVPVNDVYIVENLDTSIDVFDVSMANVELGASVSTSASTVTFAVDDSMRVDSVAVDTQEGDTYSITLDSSSDQDVYENVELNGVSTGGTVELSQIAGELAMANCQGADLTLDGTTSSVDEPEDEPAPHVHTWNNGKVTKAADCKNTGIMTYSCSGCGSTKTETIPIASGVHKYGSWQTKTEATVFEAEVQKRSCSVCGVLELREYGTVLTPTISVNATSIPLKTGQTTKALKVTNLAAGDSIASWKSSNTKIVKVSGSGKITALKKTGKATITITLASGLTKKVKVTVQKTAVKTKKISGLSKSITLQKGKKTTLKPVITPITSLEKVKYTSSNKKVATVTSSGKVTAKAPGTAKITVKSGSKKFVVKVTVPKPEVTGISNVKSKITLQKGKSVTLKPKLKPSGADSKITYKSSNKSIVSVSSAGKVTAKKKGKAVITVKAGKVSVECVVTVK